MKIARIATSVVLSIIGVASFATQPSELEERAAIRAQAKDAYIAGNFESLKRQHGQYGDFLRQRTSSGAFKMTLFFDGIADAKRDAKEDWLLQDIERTNRWTKEHQDAPLAHVLHAAALGAYGGYFRGNDFANTVPPQAWKTYEEYVRRAGAYLLESEAVAGASTTWHMWALNVARSAGWSTDVVQRIFEAGVNKNPNDFTLYRNVLEYLLPRWHGDAQAVDSFIRYAVRRAPKEYGLELYARLYSAAGEAEFERRLYSNSLIEWSTMREGLELWYQRFPTSWNKNIVAYHACIAGDKPLAKRLLEEIGAQPQWQIWQPRAEATFATCVRWAADPQAEPTAPRQKTPEESKRVQQDEPHSAA